MSSPQPVPGVPIRPPIRSPGPGEVIIGYELYSPETGCCKCDGMTAGGLFSVIILLLVFWPAACVPCCMEECFEKQQRPVYGPPGSAPFQNPPYQGPPPGQGYPSQMTGQHYPSQQGQSQYPPPSVPQSQYPSQREYPADKPVEGMPVGQTQKVV